MSPLSFRQGIVQFADFEVDLCSGELRKSGVRIKLQVQPFEVLQALLERPGHVVTREDLQRRIWPADTFVDFDQGLNNAVKKLRLALTDRPERPQFIETIPKRGYRFIGHLRGDLVAAAGEPVPPTLTPTTLQPSEAIAQKRRPRSVIWGAALVMLLAAAFLTFRFDKRTRGVSSDVSAAPHIRSLAVLPLENLSEDPTQDYFSDGLTDALITGIAQNGSVRVISRTSSMQYKRTKKPLAEIARELNVDGVIEGTVQRSGDRVRITAQLVYAPSDKHLWANSYERDLRDLFALERDVAGDIARHVQARLTTDTSAAFAELRPVNTVALEAYLRANSHMHRFSRGSGDQELQLASQYFRQAIDAEPNFAPAYLGISKARHGTMKSSAEDLETARKSAARAVELDPNLSDAWTQLGDIQCDFWEWAAAEQDYRRALELNTNDALAHEHLGWILEAFGQMEEGWKEAELAQQLDPNQEHLEVAFDHRHQYDQSIRHLSTMLEADPNNGVLHHKLYESYAGKRMYKEAVEQLGQTLVLFGLPRSAAKLREAFAATGYKGAMRTYAKELEHLDAADQLFVPINVAIAYTAAGDNDRAFYWLEQGYKFRGRGTTGYPMVLLNREPLLEPLHSDPRYADLLRRLALPR